MTATDDAPDTTPEQRWQHIEDRLAAVERTIRQLGNQTLAALDTHLAALDALRHDLARPTWPPRDLPTATNPAAVPPQPAHSPTENRGLL
ncbi:hypothetical protein ACWGB8_28735 [Kitasatospora sp. NPDC054939]